MGTVVSNSGREVTFRSPVSSIGDEVSSARAHLAELFDAHEEAVYGFLLARSGDRSLAEDLTTEVFLSIARRCAAEPAWIFTLEGSSLLTIARRRLVDHWRSREAERRRLERFAYEQLRAESSDDPADGLHDDAILDALTTLPERQRAVLSLRYLDDLSVAEIATCLELSHAATESLLAARGDADLDAAPAGTAVGAEEAGAEEVGADSSADGMSCADGDFDVIDPPPVVVADPEPSVVGAFRGARSVDGQHLVSDLEETAGSIAPMVLPAGRHETGVLGTPLVLDLQTPWRMMRADPGLLVLADPADTSVNDRPVLFLGRPAALTLPAVAGDPTAGAPTDPTTGPVPEDLADWLQQVPALVVDTCTRTTVAGLDATAYDLHVDPDQGDTGFCMSPGECVTAFVWHTSGPATDTTTRFRDQATYRLWEIKQPDDGLVAVVKSPAEEEESWKERTTALLDALSVDEPERSRFPTRPSVRPRGSCRQAPSFPSRSPSSP